MAWYYSWDALVSSTRFSLIIMMRLYMGLLTAASLLFPAQSADCPGYNVVAASDNGHTLHADLTMSGPACNIYADDLPNLKLEVEYETCKLVPFCPLVGVDGGDDVRRDLQLTPQQSFPSSRQNLRRR